MASFAVGSSTALTLDEWDTLTVTGSARLQITVGTKPVFETQTGGATIIFGPYGSVTTMTLIGVGAGTYTQQPSLTPVPVVMVDMTSAQIAAPTAAQLAATNVLYQINLAPYTLYQSNGTALVALGGGGGSTRTFRGVVATQAAMLALSASVVGDWCERSDVGNQVFELTTSGYATLANWTAYGLGTSSSANPPVTATAGFTFAQASHENRDIGFNSASPGTFVFDGTAAFNNKGSFRLMQEGAGVATLSISGVTLTNPRSFSLVTAGIGTYIDAEWDSVIPGLVITATGSGATAVTTLGILSQMTSQYGMSIPQYVGSVGYTTLGMSGPTAVGTGPATASIADGTVGFGQLRRVRYPTAVAATNNQCGFYRNTPYFKVNAAGDYNGGFPVLLAASISDVTPAQGTLFLGLGNGVANTATLEPSAFTAALLGIEKDSADANLSVIYNSPGGTPTRVALGAAFVSAQYKAFAVLIDKNQAGTSFNITPYYLDSASDLWVTGSTTVASTNIPTAASTLLAQICIRSSLAASLALSVDDHGMWRGKTAGL